MPSLKLSVLNATHPDYDCAELDQYEALYEGGKDWHKLVATWLPQNAQEPLDLWNERKAMATYDNHAGPIIDLIVAWLFSKPPTVDGVDADWLRNVDRKGATLPVWLRDPVTDALCDGRCFVWVNAPARPEGDAAPTNRKDEETAGLHVPFLVDLDAENVRDWGEDANGNLAWILCRHYIDQRTGVDSGRTKKWVWTWIDATQIRRWEFEPKAGQTETFPDGAEATEQAVIAHGFGRMPVARLEFPAGLHVMRKLRDPVLALTRLENDYDWRLHRDAHNLLVLKTADAARKPTLGAGYYLIVGEKDSVDYVSPGGEVYDALQKRIDTKRETVYRLVQQMAQAVSGKSTQQAASGAAKALDWQSLQVMLAAYADLVKALIRTICQIATPALVGPVGVAKAREGIVVGGLEGWQEDDLQKVLEDFATAGPMVKSPTFRKWLAKETVARIAPHLDDKTRQAIEGEIEGADYEDPAAWTAPPRPLKPGAGADPGVTPGEDASAA
jgi:hypothetical protein